MANRKLSKDEMIITSKHPEWLDTLVADRHCNDKLYKIILFFVIFSPCSKYCTQGRTLQFYNWKEKPWSTNRYLKSRLDDGVFTDRRNYFRCAEKISSLIEDFRKTDLGDNFYLHRAVERVAFTKVESSEYMSLFYHIRCALAHGRIAMFEDAATKDIVFVMENGIENGAGFWVKARMILREITLLRWIDIITAGPKEGEKDYHYEIYEALLNNKKLRKKDLVVMFNESEYAINKAIDSLKKAEILAYQNHGKNSWWEINITNAQAYFKSKSL